MFDIDVREDGVRPIPNKNFEVVQLDDNPAQLMKIWSVHPSEVKYALVKCLQENVDFSVISPYKMSDIDPTVAYHQLNVNLNAQTSLIE